MRTSRSKQLCSFTFLILGMVNGSQGFAMMRPSRISFLPQNPTKLLITNVSVSYCSNSCRFWYHKNWLGGNWSPYGLQCWEVSTEQQQLIVCMFMMCRASLLPGVDLHVYGNPVHMLPTEDFLSLCILVRLSTIAKKNKIKIALYNMRFAMKY